MVVYKDGDGFNENALCTKLPGLPYFTTVSAQSTGNNTSYVYCQGSDPHSAATAPSTAQVRILILNPWCTFYKNDLPK